MRLLLASFTRGFILLDFMMGRLMHIFTGRAGEKKTLNDSGAKFDSILALSKLL